MGKGVSTKTKQAKKTRLSEEEFKKQVVAAGVLYDQGKLEEAAAVLKAAMKVVPTISVWSATWSQDESRILTHSHDGTARVWAAESGQELTRLEGYTNLVNQATWSQDESRILTLDEDDTLRIWYSHTADLIEAVCQKWVLRNMTWDEWNRIMEEPYRPTCANAPIPPDAMDGIVDNEVKPLAKTGQFEAASARLAMLVGWLQENGQYNTFGAPLEESLASLRSGENPWSE